MKIATAWKKAQIKFNGDTALVNRYLKLIAEGERRARMETSK